MPIFQAVKAVSWGLMSY